MDSTLGSEPRRRGRLVTPVKRPHESHTGHLPQVSLADGEGSETEEGHSTAAVPKKRRRGPRVRASNDPDEEDSSSKKLSSQGNYSGRRRNRHPSARGGRDGPHSLSLCFCLFLSLPQFDKGSSFLYLSNVGFFSIRPCIYIYILNHIHFQMYINCNKKNIMQLV